MMNQPSNNLIGSIKNTHLTLPKTYSKSANDNTPIVNLPLDIKIQIFSQLGKKDLLAVKQTCVGLSSIHLNSNILANAVGNTKNGFSFHELLFIFKIKDVSIKKLAIDFSNKVVSSHETREMTDVEICQLINCLPRLDVLSIKTKCLWKVEVVRKIANLNHLKSLAISNQDNEGLFEILKKCPELSYLSLYFCSIGRETAEKISSLEKLVTLNLIRPETDYLNLTDCIKCKNLKHLKFSHSNFNTQLLEQIATLQNLCTLYLKKCNFTTFVKFENLPKVRVIFIKNCGPRL